MAITQKPKLGLILFSAILVLFFFFFSVAILPTEAVSDSNTPTVHELLPQFGLPSGLFPDSVVNYTFSPPTGYFAVKLKKPCYLQFTELLYYADTITGVLGNGFLTHLTGIEMKRLWIIWYDVVEITVDVSPPGIIYLKFGGDNMEFDVDEFQSVKSCVNSGSFKRVLQLTVNKAANLSKGTGMLASE